MFDKFTSGTINVFFRKFQIHSIVLQLSKLARIGYNKLLLTQIING